MNTEAPPLDESKKPQWRPLTRVQRRVAGVLIEKAKTTPDAYPMTLNAVTTGCNQKSNRHPQMQLGAEEVEETLGQLREMGAVAEVLGGGRVAKYRHYLYEWLGVDKVEIAVMAELLLRGEQTVGELRGRASRMEPIGDLNLLRPILDKLQEKGLVVFLTPEGRGQALTHGLCSERELNELRQQHAASEGRAARAPRSETPPAAAVDNDELETLRREVEQLRDEVAALRQRLEHIETAPS